MKVFNQTRKTILAQNLIIPKTLLDQSLGLLKHKSPTAILFKTRYGIHTFSMKYPIDVIILDNANKVVAIKENLKPNRIFVWNAKYDTVLELPAEIIKKTKTQINDLINLDYFIDTKYKK